MKIINKIRTFCPFCNAHSVHTVRLASKGRPRTLAWGNRQHERVIKGYVGKVAGEKTVRKQGKRQKITLECGTCKKKHERIVGTRTTKKLEIKT